MLNSTKKDIIIFYIPNSINHNFSYECSVPKFSASKWVFIDGETNSNVEALTGRESNISTKDKDQDAKTLSSGENGFSIED